MWSLTSVAEKELGGLPLSIDSSSITRKTRGWSTSAGHRALEPVQVSPRSHPFASGRQTTVAGWKASLGQALLVPSQVSAVSQTPAGPRQVVSAPFFASAGQAWLAAPV